MAVSEKVKLLALGTAVSVVVSLTSVLMTAYVGNFETKAASKQSDVILEGMIKEEKSEREKEVALMQKDIEYIKKGVDEIKQLLKK